MLHIRPAKITDLAAITEIYNEAVLNTTATFDTDPKTLAEQEAWLAEHSTPNHPVLVAELGDQVVGWASMSAWSGRCAYAETGEISLYVAANQRGQGIGKQLMAAIMQAGQAGGLHTVLARIVGGNAVSIRLHEAEGFQLVGVMREVGYKFEQQLDIYLMQKIYGA
jgi:phosphinothricin acetyltransferase